MLADSRTRLALSREVGVLTGEAHPVLPRLLRSGLDTEVAHLVMEYVAGDTVDDLAEITPLRPTVAAVLAMDLLSAVGSLHRRGVAHLDVSPANVLMREHRTTLLGFGAARTLGSAQPAARPGAALGYAAPESTAGEPVTAAMDVYGIGATLRQALTGLSPFDPDPRRRRAATAPLAVAPGEVSIHALAAAMLATDPADRPDVPAAMHAVGALCDPAGAWPVRHGGTANGRRVAG